MELEKEACVHPILNNTCDKKDFETINNLETKINEMKIEQNHTNMILENLEFSLNCLAEKIENGYTKKDLPQSPESKTFADMPKNKFHEKSKAQTPAKEAQKTDIKDNKDSVCNEENNKSDVGESSFITWTDWDYNQDNDNTEDKEPTVFILHDSILNGVRMKSLSQSYNINIEDCKTPTINEATLKLAEIEPNDQDIIFIHRSINDLKSKSPENASKEIINVKEQVPSQIKVVISNNITCRDKELDVKNTLYNALVYAGLHMKKNISFIKNDNVNEKYHLSQDGIHVNHQGSSMLASNIGKHIQWVLGWKPAPRRRRRHHQQGPFRPPTEGLYSDGRRRSPPRDGRYSERRPPPRGYRHFGRRPPPEEDDYFGRRPPPGDDDYFDHRTPRGNVGYPSRQPPRDDRYLGQRRPGNFGYHRQKYREQRFNNKNKSNNYRFN